MIGWDWDTSGETALMTAVNSWPGLTPEHRQAKHTLLFTFSLRKRSRRSYLLGADSNRAWPELTEVIMSVICISMERWLSNECRWGPHSTFDCDLFECSSEPPHHQGAQSGASLEQKLACAHLSPGSRRGSVPGVWSILAGPADLLVGNSTCTYSSICGRRHGL